MGSQIVYLILTCTILCIMVYWLVSDYMQIVPAIILANIIGAFVLALRIVTASVSYTHLDVYKRQLSEDGDEICRCCTPDGWTRLDVVL